MSSQPTSTRFCAEKEASSTSPPEESFAETLLFSARSPISRYSGRLSNIWTVFPAAMPLSAIAGVSEAATRTLATTLIATMPIAPPTAPPMVFTTLVPPWPDIESA
ncbi:hypothetical protein C5C18_10810 [Rathayibacter tritici]|nr:hypothetical protein C5C21_09410 [Rathayibacter tritici]PPG06355.1 hypothetical protein C5C18_10810 [Rathayibacter tritici]